MLPSRVTLQLLAFVFLSGAVATNIFFMQRDGRYAVRMPSAEDAWNIAALEASGIGDTGSIGDATASTPLVVGAPSLGAAAAAADTLSYQETTRAVQRELQIRGYETGSRDGVVGVMTRGAILAYEHDHGLALTARPSQELLKAIILGEDGKKNAGKAAATSSEAREVIRSVQASLQRLGYKPGAASGKPTKETMRAIRAFEADQALPQTGRVSGPLIARLSRLAGGGRVAAKP